MENYRKSKKQKKSTVKLIKSFIEKSPYISDWAIGK